MIVIFNDIKEHDLFNDLMLRGLRIDNYEPFSEALYINSYRISPEITCDYVKSYIKDNYSLT